MRTTRTMLATAAATAVLALGAPAAYAAGGDWSSDDSSYSTGNSWSGSHDGPRGGMHTGGGALSLRPADSGQGKDWGSGSSSSSGSGSGTASTGSGSSGWTKDSGSSSSSGKPHGGMHTGGGALAEPSVTAGGLAVLGLAAAGLWTARRKKSATGLA
jgi:hypothetical protein